MIHDFRAEIAHQSRRLGRFLLIGFLAALQASPLLAKVVVFWQAGFPTVASQPVERSSLAKALDGMGAQFADLSGLNEPATLSDADVLILPYGSAEIGRA